MLEIVALRFGWLTLYAVVLHRLGSILLRSRVRRALDATSGTVLVALGIRVATETRS
jgi:threonine/homoserine/homoserine lactone efflux protein